MTQTQALKVLARGDNVFLTGPPGSGKTFVLRKFVKQAQARGKTVAITATTGIAATHLEGVTIHSWSGIGIKDYFSSLELDSLVSNALLKRRYTNADILVIDEVSMLDAGRLKLLDKLAKLMRGNNKPMGGIQLVLVGDLFQLPPVGSNNSNLSIYPSAIWDELNLKICYLTEQHRQIGGDELNGILGAIRGNRVNNLVVKLLESKVKASGSLLPKNALRLYAHNFDADELNQAKLSELKTKTKVYKMIEKGPKIRRENLQSAILSPRLLELKVGCQVIFTANNFKAGYANGDRGRVCGFKRGWPVVRIERGAYIIAENFHWTADINGLIVAEAWQLPLRLAWAITIHKSQGMSLDQAVIDLSRSFAPGMGYVAISRLKSIDGLYLIGINKMALNVASEIVQADIDFRKQSDLLKHQL